MCFLRRISSIIRIKFDEAAPMLYQAQVHRHAHNFREVQQCTLLSIKTGGCSEDCSYCPQSSRYDTGLKAQRLMNKDAVLEAAKKVSLFYFFILHLAPCITFQRSDFVISLGCISC